MVNHSCFDAWYPASPVILGQMHRKVNALVGEVIEHSRRNVEQRRVRRCKHQYPNADRECNEPEEEDEHDQWEQGHPHVFLVSDRDRRASEETMMLTDVSTVDEAKSADRVVHWTAVGMVLHEVRGDEGQRDGEQLERTEVIDDPETDARDGQTHENHEGEMGSGGVVVRDLRTIRIPKRG